MAKPPIIEFSRAGEPPRQVCLTSLVRERFALPRDTRHEMRQFYERFHALDRATQDYMHRIDDLAKMNGLLLSLLVEKEVISMEDAVEIGQLNLGEWRKTLDEKKK